MTEKKRKVTQSNTCKEGKHTFIVSMWQDKGGFQKAVHMRCQNCLMLMDMDEINWQEWRANEGLD